jgi:hypothetical protein
MEALSDLFINRPINRRKIPLAAAIAEPGRDTIDDRFLKGKNWLNFMNAFCWLIQVG